MKTQENKWDKFFWGLTVAALVIGLIGLLDRFTSGHTHANYGSYVPWGLWVAGYIYLMGLSAGVFLMSSLVFVFRIKVLLWLVDCWPSGWIWAMLVGYGGWL